MGKDRGRGGGVVGGEMGEKNETRGCGAVDRLDDETGCGRRA